MDGQRERLLCRCFLVPERVVREAIVREGSRTVEEVTRATNAAGGCSSCYDDIQEILDEIHGRRRAPRPPAALPNRERRQRILDVLYGAAAPLLRANGVEIHLLDVDGPRALVRVRTPDGRTTHDASILAIKHFIVRALEQACGERISLVELNVLEHWGERP